MMKQKAEKKGNTKKRYNPASEEGEKARALASEIIAITEDAVISVGRDQNILYFNRGAEKIFGYNADEIAGKPLDLLIPLRFVDAHKKTHRWFFPVAGIR